MTTLFESVLSISVEATALALLVLGARLIVGRRPGIMLTLLYTLIAVRLIVPFAVSSPFSVQNIWNVPQVVSTDGLADQEAADPSSARNFVDTSALQSEQTSVFNNTVNTPTVEGPAVMVSTDKAAPLTALDIASIIWIAGMIAFSGVMLTGNGLFLRRIRRNRDYDAPEFTALLNECKQALGLNKKIRVICASETGTAAVYGVFRPMLLISPSSFEPLTQAQKRHVLLHELSHIRRRDSLVCAGATVLNIIHWFNPLVWVVFALMRRDIEVQCDAHVFRSLPGAERTEYAGTLLRLASPVQAPKLASALFISKANIKRRIVMVVKHRRKSALFTAVALLLTVAVAVTGCTTAVDQMVEAAPPEPTPSAMVEAAPEATPTPVPEISEPVVEPVLLMASFSLDNSTHNNTNRMANIQTAVDLLNGTVIKPGEILSLNDILGPRDAKTAETVGWKEAAGIKGSAYVQEIGGGVTTVATALYNAAIRAELEIVEVKPSAIPSDLVDGGLDATISTGGPDLKIKNPYDSDVTISAKLEGTILTVSVLGPSMSYTVDFRSERVSELSSEIPIEIPIEIPATVYIYNTETAPDGTVIAPGISYEYRKTRAAITYKVFKTWYDLNGNETDTNLFAIVTYSSFQGLVYVNAPDPNTDSASSGSGSEAAVAPDPTPAPTPQPSAAAEAASE